ncbi:MAG: hypothetical protein ACLFQ1_03470 [Halochromatium sp.]|uniref:hypothetical protein n=1 Tax=Halochromatium sp. TaxID=2049430 RepID=UPI00397DF04C
MALFSIRFQTITQRTQQPLSISGRPERNHLGLLTVQFDLSEFSLYGFPISLQLRNTAPIGGRCCIGVFSAQLDQSVELALQRLQPAAQLTEIR